MNKIEKTLILAVISTMPAITYAKDDNESGFYAVVTAGQTTAKMSLFNEELKNNSWSIGAGYDINKYLAAELSYNNLGERSYSSSFGQISSESMRSWAGSFIARYPSGNYVPYARLGYAKVNIELEGFTAGLPSSRTVNTPIYGIGIELKLDELASVRLEYSTSSATADYGGNTKLNTFQGGVVIRF